MTVVTAHLTDAAGRTQTVRAKPGVSLMRAATDAGVEGIAADCGGSLSCATCHVYVAADWVAALPAPDRDEASMLEMTAAERRPGSRLSCQIVLTPVLDGLQVQLPVTQYG